MLKKEKNPTSNISSQIDTKESEIKEKAEPTEFKPIYKTEKPNVIVEVKEDNSIKKQEDNNDFYEYAKTIKNVQLLNNLLHLCVEKQDIIDSIDTLTIIENLFDICENDNQIIKVYENIKLFDRMYFYEVRKELNEILYNVFHNTKNKYIKLVSLETARYFKITKIFKNKLNEKELVFYNENMN